MLEIMFMKHCVPNHLLGHMDGAFFKDESHLKFEASSYTTHHPLSADLAIIIFVLA